MRGRIFGSLVVLAVMTLVICGGAAPALAQTTWSVVNPDDDGSFTGTAGALTLTNADTGATISCSSWRLDGTIPTAAGVHEVGRLDFGDATGCAGPGGSSPAVWLVGPVYVEGESYDPTTGQATLEAIAPTAPLSVSEPGCDYDASGSFPMTYANSSSELVIDGAAFTVTWVSGPGCGGVVDTGDTLELSVTHTVTPAITMTAGPPRFTVTGSTSGGAYTTTQSSTTTHVLGDLTTSNTSPCSAATVAGRIPDGTDLPGAGIGSVTSANLGRCSLFPDADGVFTITPVNLPWRLDAVSYVGTDGGVVAGSIPNFELSVAGPGCSFSVTSTPTATDWQYGEFNDTPNVLIISPDDAQITNVSGCGGAFNDGDEAWYSNGYAVSPTTLQITAR